jgi:hypothetical protein
MKFPVISAANLSRRKYSLPGDFEGKYNLVFIPFQQNQQWTINSWLEFAQDLEANFHNLRVYELPTLQNMNSLSQKFITEGMRAGIQDQKLRDKVITLFVDKSAFRRLLGIQNEEDVSVMLLDRAGNVLWRSRGDFTPEKKQSLLMALDQMRVPAQPVQVPALNVA